MVEIRLHKMSPSMEEGLIVEWVRGEGDAVREGEPVAQVETDKAVVDLPAPADGRLVRILQPKGARVPVGTVLAEME